MIYEPKLVCNRQLNDKRGALLLFAGYVNGALVVLNDLFGYT
jgi:hypothetical protein